jgi:hypothetical protein
MPYSLVTWIGLIDVGFPNSAPDTGPAAGAGWPAAAAGAGALLVRDLGQLGLDRRLLRVDRRDLGLGGGLLRRQLLLLRGLLRDQALDLRLAVGGLLARLLGLRDLGVRLGLQLGDPLAHGRQPRLAVLVGRLDVGELVEHLVLGALRRGREAVLLGELLDGLRAHHDAEAGHARAALVGLPRHLADLAADLVGPLGVAGDRRADRRLLVLGVLQARGDQLRLALVAGEGLLRGGQRRLRRGELLLDRQQVLRGLLVLRAQPLERRLGVGPLLVVLRLLPLQRGLPVVEVVADRRAGRGQADQYGERARERAGDGADAERAAGGAGAHARHVRPSCSG